MDMKNVKSASYLQIDHRIERIIKRKGVVILPIKDAWEKYKIVKRYLKEKPKEGYFVWVKKQINFPISICVSISSKNIIQKMKNLLIIEKGIRARGLSLCNSILKGLNSKHYATGKIVLKENSSLDYTHFHAWGNKDEVKTNYEFVLEKNSRMSYVYKSLNSPKNLSLISNVFLKNNASINMKFLISSNNSKIDLKETINIEGKGASGNLLLRVVAQKNSKIVAHSRIIAKNNGRGHLDCQGLLIDEKSKISLIPELVNENKNAILTHEASIGKIDEEQLNYLKTRGLSEKEAIDLIVNGFLNLS